MNCFKFNLNLTEIIPSKILWKFSEEISLWMGSWKIMSVPHWKLCWWYKFVKASKNVLEKANCKKMAMFKFWVQWNIFCELLLPENVIILRIFFWILKIVYTFEQFSQNSIQYCFTEKINYYYYFFLDQLHFEELWFENKFIPI